MYITVRLTPDAEPLFATADPRVLAAMLRTIIELAGGPERPRLLHLVDQLEQGAASRGGRVKHAIN